MATLIRHDFGAIHEALNKMIIAEVKAALELLPKKKIETEDGFPLCRVVVSDSAEYEPVDASVTKVWLEKDGTLCFLGTVHGCSGLFTEEDDMLDISDFGYLIDQIAEKVKRDGTYNLPNESLLTAGYMADQSLKSEIEKLVTV